MYIWQLEDWPHLTWDADSLQPQLESVRLQQGRLLGQSDTLSTEIDQQTRMDVLIQNAIQTSKIEG